MNMSGVSCTPDMFIGGQRQLQWEPTHAFTDAPGTAPPGA